MEATSQHGIVFLADSPSFFLLRGAISQNLELVNLAMLTGQ